MSHYWADWDTSHLPQVLRRDTRLYWHPQPAGTTGRCVGTFVGENPGGGQSIHGLTYHGRSPLEHGGKAGDQTLRLLLEIWQLAVCRYGLALPACDDYIQILNTYYFRSPVSGSALSAWRSSRGASIYCPGPAPSSRFVLLGWGVGHNASAEAGHMVPLLRPCARIVIPDSAGAVRTVLGTTLVHPLGPRPVAPSFILRKSRTLLRPYMDNVAQSL